jgi:uncharacterized protein (TIGR02099 family)
MTTSSVLNQILNKLYKIIAILLVLFAVFLSALRIFLPYAEDYKQGLQNYLNKTYQSNIIIGNINAGWEKLGPTLVAQNVSVVDSQSINIFIKQIDFSIDFWGSIQSGKLITNDFTLKGTKVTIDQEALQKDTSASKNTPILSRLGDLFLKQVSRFSLRNSQLVLYSHQKRPRTIFIEQLEWLNNDGRHQGNGEIVFDDISSNNIKLKLDITGDALNDVNGKVFLSANNVDITPWLSQVLPIKSTENKTSINVDTWLFIENGQRKRLQLAFGENKLKWNMLGNEHQLTLEKGQVFAESTDDFTSFNLFSSPLSIKFDQQQWQPVTIQFTKKIASNQFYASYASLSGISHLLPFFIDDKNTLQQIKDAAIQGDLADIYLKQNEQNTSFSVQLSQVKSQYADGIPGIENLSGNLIVDNNNAQLLMKAESGALDFGPNFKQPIAYDLISSTVNMQFTEQQWRIFSDNLMFNAGALRLTSELNVQQQAEKPVELSLFANVQQVDAKQVRQYYPHLLMGNNLVDYLNDSLLSGQISNANVLFNGELSNFPFTDHSGIFTVEAKLNNSEFKFSPEWPAIQNFSANLNFTNNSMLITAEQGSLSGINVMGVTAGIDDLSSNAVLEIKAPIVDATPAAISDLMDNSSLKNSVGKTLAVVQIKQPVNGQFHLTVPLDIPENTVAKGEIDFANNQVHLQAPDMLFTQVNGKLFFENDKISTSEISLNWYDLPLTITATTENKTEYFLTSIGINANWQESTYQAFIPQSLQQYIHNAFKWQGDLSLFTPHDGEFSYHLTINSTLQDTQLNLPQPFDKKATINMPLVATVNGQSEQSTIEANLGKQLSFFGVLNHQQQHFTRAHLLIGHEQMLLPMNGFHISANLEQAQLSEWQPFISNIVTSISYATDDNSQPKQPLLFDKPKRIRGVVAEFDVLGEQLHDVSFNLLDQTNWWLLQVNAKEARSEIKLYPDMKQQGIDIKADFIHIPAVEADQKTVQASEQNKNEQATAILPSVAQQKATALLVQQQIEANRALFSKIPIIRFQCESCQYGLLDLGKFSFDISRPDPHTLAFKHISAKRDKTALTAEGFWQLTPEKSNTAFMGTIKTKDVAHEIEKMGFASVVKESGATLDFDINWQESPFDFSLANVNGDISARLTDGYLAEVSDKGARIFSVLSLQSLVRKLKLDFRDIFSDGMFYSKIKGDFHLKHGVLYTDNTKMDGAAGDLSIKGNTKLQEGILDYRMSYKPNLTSSLPVLAWIATLNPVSIIAGFALDEVFTSKVVSEFDFELTGDVNNPNLREVNRKNRNISVGRSTPPKFVDSTDVAVDENNADKNNLSEKKEIEQQKNNNSAQPKSSDNGKTEQLKQGES